MAGCSLPSRHLRTILGVSAPGPRCTTGSRGVCLVRLRGLGGIGSHWGCYILGSVYLSVRVRRFCSGARPSSFELVPWLFTQEAGHSVPSPDAGLLGTDHLGCGSVRHVLAIFESEECACHSVTYVRTCTTAKNTVKGRAQTRSPEALQWNPTLRCPKSYRRPNRAKHTVSAAVMARTCLLGKDRHT